MSNLHLGPPLTPWSRAADQVAAVADATAALALLLRHSGATSVPPGGEMSHPDVAVEVREGIKVWAEATERLAGTARELLA